MPLRNGKMTLTMQTAPRNDPRPRGSRHWQALPIKMHLKMLKLRRLCKLLEQRRHLFGLFERDNVVQTNANATN